MSTIDELKKVRLTKLQELKKHNIDPFPSVVCRKHTIDQAILGIGKDVSIVGRIMTRRNHGKIIFIDVVDDTGKIQGVCKADVMQKESYQLLEYIDNGDFIVMQGTVGKTVAGEISVFVSEMKIISKSLRPLPDKWHGLSDVEERYRQRYVDLLVNDEVRKIFLTRSKVITFLRKWLDKDNFLEVETPVLQPIYGGASAKPFITHHNAMDADFYLRIAVELYLKRLIVGGFEKVYEIGKDFRNEGIDKEHNPEFTMLEFYWAYADYETLMVYTEKMLSEVTRYITGSMEINYEGKRLNFKPPWQRITYRDAVLQYTGIDINIIDDETKLLSEIKDHNIQLDVTGVIGYGVLLDTLYKSKVRPNLTGPLFLTNRPTAFVSLAKRLPKDPRYTASFQALAAGRELLNAYNELNDPLDQAKRWHESEKLGAKGQEEHEQFDYDYIRALEYGMPPTAGWGMGIDRLVAILTNQHSLKDVILFPTLKPEITIGTFHSISKPAYFAIDAGLKERYPSISVGIALIKGVSIKKTDPKLEEEKRRCIENLHGLTTEEIGQYPEIASYRKLYKEMGVDWHSRRPSPEALLRRIALGKGLYTVNTCVDAYNLVVIKYRVSAGAFNADAMQFPTMLRFGRDKDAILLLGDSEETRCTTDEFVYSDRVGGFNIDLNYRDAGRTKITEKTKNVWLNVDGIYDITPGKVEEVLNETIKMITKYCGGTVEFKGVAVNVGSSMILEHDVSQTVQLKSDMNLGISYKQAQELLQTYIKDPVTRMHCIESEAIMRALARHFGENEEAWGIVGLLHDIDWELTKDNTKLNCIKTAEILKNAGGTEYLIATIQSHGYGQGWGDTYYGPPEFEGKARSGTVQHALAAAETLTGLIVATALIQQDKKLVSVKPESLLKKFKNKKFAANCNRDIILECEKIGIPLEEFLSISLKALQEISYNLGL